MPRSFSELTEREIIALAISQEEEDGRIYADFAEGLQERFPASAKVFLEMVDEESEHRRRLIALFRQRFGEHIPLIRRQDVKAYIPRPAVWLVRPLGLEKVRDQASIMESQARRFYLAAARRAADASTRQLLGDLAAAEAGHIASAEALQKEHLHDAARATEDQANHRLFVMQIVQPALAGLMDGSVSTLAPLFAAAFATRSHWDAFAVGVAASVGAGISMGFAEALSDDGALTGRGHPLIRGIVCGIATTLGGIGHTLPYLIPNFNTATLVAVAIVIVELWVIAWIRRRYMDTPFLQAAFQVVVGGVLVLGAGLLIGWLVPGGGGG